VPLQNEAFLRKFEGGLMRTSLGILERLPQKRRAMAAQLNRTNLQGLKPIIDLDSLRHDRGHALIRSSLRIPEPQSRALIQKRQSSISADREVVPFFTRGRSRL
jgi:hypothetical protein